MNDDIAAHELRPAVEIILNCEARFTASLPIQESREGQITWDGVVGQFKLVGHPEAKECYAWYSPDGESVRGRYRVVLKTGKIQSPNDAVRAAVAKDPKDGKA